jgi:hypothetical protein
MSKEIKFSNSKYNRNPLDIFSEIIHLIYKPTKVSFAEQEIRQLLAKSRDDTTLCYKLTKKQKWLILCLS